MSLIAGLEEKLNNITNILSKTDKNSQTFKTYTDIANQLAKDIHNQKNLLGPQ